MHNPQLYPQLFAEEHKSLLLFRKKIPQISQLCGITFIKFEIAQKSFVILNDENEGTASQVISSEDLLKDICPEDHKIVETLISDMQDKTIDHRHTECRYRTDRGFEWFSISVAEYEKDDKEDILSYICLCQNIEAGKKELGNMEELKNRAEENDRLKSAYLANMSHEIRTPLNAIVGFSDLMADEESKDERKKFIKVIRENNDLLLQLISDILDYSKMEAGMMQLNYSQVDVNELCEEIAESMRFKIHNDVKIIFSPTYENCFIKTDAKRLNQVISNFVANAIKFTPSGNITISYEWLDDSNIRFAVKDTGIGIDKGLLDHIFGRYVQIDSYSIGTGLGLSICKNIINLLGGQIGADSVLGKGSTFWAVLPSCRKLSGGIAENREEEVNKSGTGTHVEGKTMARKKVLIAEDSDNNYLLAKYALEKDFCLVRASNGMDAICKYASEHPDIVLMDIMMPKMDGLTATKIIRETDRKTPILAVSASAFDEDKKKASMAGCTGYITKPINIQTLKDTIWEAIK